MFPLLEWEVGNIKRQKKQFIKQKIWSNTEVSPSKQVHLTNSYVEDTKPWRHTEIKILYTVICNVRTLNIVRLKIVNAFCINLRVPKSSFISLSISLSVCLFVCLSVWLLLFCPENILSKFNLWISSLALVSSYQ